MKPLAILLFTLATTALHAQVTLQASAGISGTSVHARHIYEDHSDLGYKPGKSQGWQAALRAEYRRHNFIFYTGVGLDKRYFYNSYNNYDDQGLYYKPLYLTLPLGAGYNISIAKNLGFRLYGGLYGMAGIGGSYRYKAQAVWCEFACPENLDQVKNIQYVNSNSIATNLQLMRYSWGGQLGAGVNLFNRFELAWMYSSGFSPIRPKDYSVNFYRMRASSLDVKVKLATFAHAKGK